VHAAQFFDLQIRRGLEGGLNVAGVALAQAESQVGGTTLYQLPWIKTLGCLKP
jgi:hypothetical protein